MEFEASIDTSKGVYILKSNLSEEQVKYLVELGYRYLLTIGAIALPEKTKIPDEAELEQLATVGDDFKRTLN